MSNNSNASGFTLIEMVIVVLIIGVISAIAFPSYDSYVKKARRGDGTETLLAAAQNLEVYRGQRGSYTTNAAIANIETTSPDGYYNNLNNQGEPCGDIDNCYTITIVPTTKNGQNRDDVQCFRLRSNGAKEWHPTSCTAGSGWHDGW